MGKWGVLAALIVWAGCAAPSALPPEVETFLQSADSALSVQDAQAALAWTERAEDVAPGHPAIAAKRGTIAYVLGQYDEARTQLEQAVAQDPTAAEWWMVLGDVAFQQERFEDALGFYTRSVEAAATPEAWLGAANAHWELDEVDEARQACEQALLADSTYAPAHSSLADVLEELGDFEPALAHATDALRLQPDEPIYRTQVGVLLFKTERWVPAANMLYPVVERQPWNYTALFTIGQALQQLGHAEPAAEFLKQASVVQQQDTQLRLAQQSAALQPTSAEAQVKVAEQLLEAGREAEAIQAFMRVQLLRPDNLGVQHTIASLLLGIGERDEARRRYASILAADSSYVEAAVSLGAILYEDGQPGAARALWQTSLKRAPDNANLRSLLAQTQPANVDS
ncbi:MAG: tetratricopeptide repeat protein [Bacteroidota bacterium]